MKTNQQRVKEIVSLGKKLNDYDEMINILSKEIEDNLFDNNESTFINFIITKKETMNVSKSKIANMPIDIFEDADDTLQADVTHVSYSESARIPEELAIKLQNEVLKYYKRERRKLLKQLKEI